MELKDKPALDLSSWAAQALGDRGHTNSPYALPQAATALSASSQLCMVGLVPQGKEAGRAKFFSGIQVLAKLTGVSSALGSMNPKLAKWGMWVHTDFFVGGMAP